MTLLEKALYLRAFQKARATGKVRSRTIPVDQSYRAAVGELVRTLLSPYFRVSRSRDRYRIQAVARTALTGVVDQLEAIGANELVRAIRTRDRYEADHGVTMTIASDETTLDMAIAVLPILKQMGPVSADASVATPTNTPTQSIPRVTVPTTQTGPAHDPTPTGGRRFVDFETAQDETPTPDGMRRFEDALDAVMGGRTHA